MVDIGIFFRENISLIEKIFLPQSIKSISGNAPFMRVYFYSQFIKFEI